MKVMIMGIGDAINIDKPQLILLGARPVNLLI
jgi:hypothetical protein